MSKPLAKPLVAGPACCNSIAGTVVSHFVTRLLAEVDAVGGAVTGGQIRFLASTFLKDDKFEALFQRHFDKCTAAREAALFEQARRYPFDRVMMKRFAHLFPARAGDDGGRVGVLSRRVIPGFTEALNKMIGPLLYDQCQTRCQEVVDRHRRPDGGTIDWEPVYRDPATRAMVNDVLVVMAHHFDNFDKRREWFITVVNTHLAPGQANAADETWQLDARSFGQLMTGLFADLRAEVVADAMRIRSHYGERTYDCLQEFFRRLDG